MQRELLIQLKYSTYIAIQCNQINTQVVPLQTTQGWWVLVDKERKKDKEDKTKPSIGYAKYEIFILICG